MGAIQQNKNAEMIFFDHFGEDVGYDVLHEEGYRRIIGEFMKYFSPRKDLRVIDFGCGTGSFTAKFSHYGMDLFGIDISSNCIKYAREKHPNIIFEVGDIEHTKYPDKSFDVVFLGGVLHHFADFSNVLNECYRILKPKGIILGYDPNGHNPFMWLYRSRNSPFYSSKGITENERLLTKNDIRNVLVSIGFSEYKVYSISGVTYRYLDNRASFLILPTYNFIEKVLDVLPISRQFGSLIITYARKG